MLKMVSREKNRPESKSRLLKNRYFRDSKLSEREFLKVLRGFADDLSTSEAARKSDVSLRSVNDIYVHLRGRIWREVWIDHDLFNGMGGYLRICAETHLRRDGKKLEYEGNPFDVVKANARNSSFAVSDALEVKEELYNENVRRLWAKRKFERRLPKTQTTWSHVVEIYARERSGTLQRPNSSEAFDEFSAAFLKAKQRRDEAACWRILEDWEEDKRRFQYRGEGNKRFFDDLKRMLKRNPL